MRYIDQTLHVTVFWLTDASGGGGREHTGIIWWNVCSRRQVHHRSRLPGGLPSVVTWWGLNQSLYFILLCVLLHVFIQCTILWLPIWKINYDGVTIAKFYHIPVLLLDINRDFGNCLWSSLIENDRNYLKSYFLSNLNLGEDFPCIHILVFESAREARRLFTIMCIGFLANHRLCKPPQIQLVCVYQCLFTIF